MWWTFGKNKQQPVPSSLTTSLPPFTPNPHSCENRTQTNDAGTPPHSTLLPPLLHPLHTLSLACKCITQTGGGVCKDRPCNQPGVLTCQWALVIL